MKASITEKLLYIIATVLDHNRRCFSWQLALSAMDGDPRLSKHRRWLKRKLRNKKERQKLYRALHDLKRRRYLESKIFNNSNGYILSPKGSLKASLITLKEIKKKKLPNNQYLMIFFDIPEKKRLLRDKLRFILRELGFERIQKSVWVTSYDVTKEIKQIIKDSQLDEHVRPLIVKEMIN